jgi:hypothetical protein
MSALPSKNGHAHSRHQCLQSATSGHEARTALSARAPALFSYAPPYSAPKSMPSLGQRPTSNLGRSNNPLQTSAEDDGCSRGAGRLPRNDASIDGCHPGLAPKDARVRGRARRVGSRWKLIVCFFGKYEIALLRFAIHQHRSPIARLCVQGPCDHNRLRHAVQAPFIHVRNGSLADNARRTSHVRFTPKSRHA